MAASVNDNFSKAEGNFSTTLSSGISSGAATIPLSSTTGLPTDTKVIISIFEADANGDPVAGTLDIKEGVVSGSNIINASTVEGTDQAHSAGDTVAMYFTETHWNEAIAAILAEHAQDGTHTDITADTLAVSGVSSLSDHIDVVDAKSIRDGNNNELVTFSQTASAVNELTVKNAATGNAPQVQATGGDTNIDFNIVPKGTGEVTKSGNPIDWWEEIGRTTLGSAGDSITVDNLPARKYLRVIATASGTNIRGNFTFNDDTSNYANRTADNGGADATATGSAAIFAGDAGGNAVRIFVDMEIINIATLEKLVYANTTTKTTAGDGATPNHRRTTSTFDNTSDQISKIVFNQTSTGDFAAGSEVIVLGHD